MTPEQALAVVETLYGQLVARRSETQRLKDYFSGRHELVYASKEWRKYHQDRFANFSDNWCGVVGRAAPERTEVFGLRLGDDVDTQSDDERQLWRDWEINDGPAQSAQGFLATAVLKRSAALVWQDIATGDPVLTWEPPDQMYVDYEPDNPRVARYALKVWVDDDSERANLYTSSEVWKWSRPRSAVVDMLGRTPAGLYVPFVSGSGGWSRRQDGGDSWPVTHRFGVLPVVEFVNRPLLGVGPISDIEGTIAMQDAINLMWGYLFVAADHASMPARVVIGAEPPKMPVLDELGQVVGEKPLDIEALTQGRMLWLTGQSDRNTSIAQWDAARLDVFTNVLNVMVKHLASQTRTPIHYIMGELGNVNGETLTATELPLAMKVREGHKHLATPVREVFRRFALVRGNTEVAEQCRTAVVQWKNPETSSDAQISDAATKDKVVGWPFAAILERRYGLSQPEIARVMAQVEAEGADPTLERVLRTVQAVPGGTA